jgi:hypothetical protein
MSGEPDRAILLPKERGRKRTDPYFLFTIADLRRFRVASADDGAHRAWFRRYQKLGEVNLWFPNPVKTLTNIAPEPPQLYIRDLLGLYCS